MLSSAAGPNHLCEEIAIHSCLSRNLSHLEPLVEGIVWVIVYLASGVFVNVIKKRETRPSNELLPGESQTQQFSMRLWHFKSAFSYVCKEADWKTCVKGVSCVLYTQEHKHTKKLIMNRHCACTP